RRPGDEHGRAARARERNRLLPDRGLPDPGLAEQRERAWPLAGGEEALDDRQLGLTPDDPRHHQSVCRAWSWRTPPCVAMLTLRACKAPEKSRLLPCSCVRNTANKEVSVMKRVLVVLVAALTLVGVAYAAAKPPILAQPLALGRVANTQSVTIAKGSKLVFVRVTVQPGGSFGWHVHHSAGAVAILRGTPSLYDTPDP